MSITLLPANVAKIADLAASDTGRYSMTSVKVDRIEETGPVLPDQKQTVQYRVEATDGKVFGRVEGVCDDATEFPEIAALKSAQNGKTSAMIPAGEFSTAFKCAGKKSKRIKPVLRNVAIVMGDNTSTLASTDLETVSSRELRNVEGRFPDTDYVLNNYTKNPPIATFKLSAAILIQIAKVAAEFADKNKDTLDFEIRANEEGKGMTPIVIKSTNGAQKFTGLIMPLS